MVSLGIEFDHLDRFGAFGIGDRSFRKKGHFGSFRGFLGDLDRQNDRLSKNWKYLMFFVTFDPKIPFFFARFARKAFFFLKNEYINFRCPPSQRNSSISSDLFNNDEQKLLQARGIDGKNNQIFEHQCFWWKFLGKNIHLVEKGQRRTRFARRSTVHASPNFRLMLMFPRFMFPSQSIFFIGREVEKISHVLRRHVMGPFVRLKPPKTRSNFDYGRWSERIGWRMAIDRILRSASETTAKLIIWESIYRTSFPQILGLFRTFLKF